MEGIKSQTNNYYIHGLPLKSGNSVLFGKDIIINNDSTQNQQLVATCSAFNGWLYVAYTYYGTYLGDHYPFFVVMKSTDNGITWTQLISNMSPFPYPCTSLDIAVTGHDFSNLKLFLAFVPSASPGLNYGNLYIWQYNEETGAYEESLFEDHQYCGYVSLSTDFNFPATNSNPQSLGVLYSRNFAFGAGADSLIFKSSSNGGVSIDGWKGVAKSVNHIHKVALTFGRSASYNAGRYFAAWEEKTNWTSNLGHIYTAHTEPYFNSSFTKPVKLDSIDATALGNAKNPTIACQYNNINNDSSNLTEIVLFDKYIPSQNRYEIEGLCNKQATNSNHFTTFSLNLSNDSRQQPSISFNTFDSSFMVTYYDSTTNKLPFIRHNFNMINADSWQIVNSGYNDSSSLVAPYPKVALSMSQQKGACVWSLEGDNGNGIAMFDAPYSDYTGIWENNDINSSIVFHAFPNPCNTLLTLDFELLRPSQVTIIIYDLIGNPIGIITDKSYSKGRHLLNQNFSKFACGSYIIILKTEDLIETCKLLIVR